MKNTILYAILSIGLALSAGPASAATVATVPDGMMQFTLVHGQTNYLSLPLTSEAIYTGAVASVTANTITVDDSPPPFTTNLATVGSPYFVKFLSGNEAGRVLLIDSNTTSMLTVDTTDHTTGSAVALTTTNFSVQTGDTFEIFPGDTLSSIFGNGTANNPLVLTGGSAVAYSDEVSLYTTVGSAAQTYYFNTTTNCWQLTNSSANANNTIIYPYSAFTVTRRPNHGDTTLVVLGRVTPVNASTRTVSRSGVYTSSHYATDIKLSQLQFGSSWLKADNAESADTISVWNAAEGRFDIYFQRPDLTWRKFGGPNVDQSNFTIPAGTVTTIQRRSAVVGASAFLVSAMPYTLE